MANPLWRWLRGAVGLAIVAYLIRFLLRNWDAVQAARIDWHVRPWLVVTSVVVTIATYGLLVESWRTMVAGWGTRLRWMVAARIWILSSMGKYLPGKVWAIAGMAVLGREAGVPPWIATASAILLQVISIGTGGLVVAATGTASLRRVSPVAGVALAALVALTGLCLAAVLVPAIRERVFRRFVAKNETIPSPTSLSIGVGIVANILAWISYGLALYWLSAGVFGDAALGPLQAIAAFTASYLAGFLFLLAPGGLGVRESVFVLLTEPTLGPGRALALAAVSRLGMTAADLLAAAPFVLRRGARRDGD